MSRIVIPHASLAMSISINQQVLIVSGGGGGNYSLGSINAWNSLWFTVSWRMNCEKITLISIIPCCTGRVVCDIHAFITAPRNKQLLKALHWALMFIKEFHATRLMSNFPLKNHSQTITKVLPWLSRCNCIQPKRTRQEGFRFPLSRQSVKAHEKAVGKLSLHW